MTNQDTQFLKDLWWVGVNAVKGFAVVGNELAENSGYTPDLIVAVGKAAGDMALGARACFQTPISTIVATKYDHVSESLVTLSNCKIFESAHPIPDENSLISGNEILDAVRSMGPKDSLLLLVSGGASSLVEVLQPGINLGDLAALNKGFMAQGLDIHQINSERKKISRVKAGQLLGAFSGKNARVIAISDVEGDSIDVIGSGIGAYHGNNPDVTIKVSGSNEVARMAIADAAKARNHAIIANQECLYGDAEKVAREIFETIDDGPNGLYIFGGEPTCVLPENPGRGGRNQHLGLLLAQMIRAREDLIILVAGTDGSDGPTQDAGAIIDGRTAIDDVSSYLLSADAGSYLAKRDALFTTGPTGTNVMDIMLIWKTG